MTAQYVMIQFVMNRIEINDYIVADPEICHGKLTFKGSRVMVWQILEMLADGETIEEILEDFPSLSQQHIKSALEYVTQIVQEGVFIPRPTHEVISR